MQQLLLFQESPEDKRERKIEDLEERYDRLRKSQHARISSLQKEIKDLKLEVEFLKANICKGIILI